MLLTTIIAAQVEITFNVRSQGGSVLKNMKINMVVNSTNFYITTNVKGEAVFTSENGSAFP
jgi:hypothetical protein